MSSPALATLPTDFYKLVEEKLPWHAGKVVAPALLTVVVIALFSGLLSAIWVTVVRPISRVASGVAPQASLLLPILTLALLLIVGVVGAREVKRLGRKMEAVGRYIALHDAELHDLTHIRADIATLTDHIAALEKHVHTGNMIPMLIDAALREKQ